MRPCPSPGRLVPQAWQAPGDVGADAFSPARRCRRGSGLPRTRSTSLRSLFPQADSETAEETMMSAADADAAFACDRQEEWQAARSMSMSTIIAKSAR